VTTPKFDANAPDAKRIGEMVKNQEGDEIYLQYIAWLQKKLGTSINEAAAAQAIGNGGSDTN
jgi:peptidyl-prolyl cis-trans isomerase D